MFLLEKHTQVMALTPGAVVLFQGWCKILVTQLVFLRRLWLESSDMTAGSFQHSSLPTSIMLSQLHPDVALGQALAHVDSSHMGRQEASCRQLVLESILSDHLQSAAGGAEGLERQLRVGSEGSCCHVGASHQEGLHAVLTPAGSLPLCRQESSAPRSFIISQQRGCDTLLSLSLFLASVSL